VIAFLEGNSKIGLRQAMVQASYYHHQPSVWAPRQNNGGDRPRKVQFSQLRKLRDLDVDLRWGRGHTGAHIWSRCTHTHQIRWKSEKLFVDVRTDGHTWVPIYRSSVA